MAGKSTSLLITKELNSQWKMKTIEIPMTRKQSGPFFVSPQLILQFTEGVQWFNYRVGYTFPRIKRGSNIFHGGGGGGGGVQMLISIETHMTCDFPRGGSGPHIPPLGPHLQLCHNLLKRNTLWSPKSKMNLLLLKRLHFSLSTL